MISYNNLLKWLESLGVVIFRRHAVTAVVGMAFLSTVGLASDSRAQATDTDVLETESRAAE